MEQTQINVIMYRMADILDNMQLAQLKHVLEPDVCIKNSCQILRVYNCCLP